MMHDRAGTGSVTITVQEAPPSPPRAEDGAASAPEFITLRLAPRRKKSVSWQDGTVDNEFLNKRSSKKCCIFHKEKPFDEDSSDDDDDAHERPEDSHDAEGRRSCEDSANPGAANDGASSSHTNCSAHHH